MNENIDMLENNAFFFIALEYISCEKQTKHPQTVGGWRDWFQTPQTVSRPSRPDFQPRKTNSGSRRPIEILKERKMITIEFPKLLAWFQTHQTVSRPSRPSRPLVPDTSDRFQTVQTRFPALKLGHFLWKKNQNGPSGVHLTHYCPQHLALISQMKVNTSTPEHCFQSPHLSISLSLMRLFRMLMR